MAFDAPFASEVAISTVDIHTKYLQSRSAVCRDRGPWCRGDRGSRCVAAIEDRGVSRRSRIAVSRRSRIAVCRDRGSRCRGDRGSRCVAIMSVCGVHTRAHACVRYVYICDHAGGMIVDHSTKESPI